MSNRVLIEWSYTPDSFLETIHELDYRGKTLTFDNGNVSFEIDQELYDSDSDFTSKTERYIEDYLDGISIQSHTSYKLSRKATKFFNDEGDLIKQSVTAKSIASSTFLGSNVEVTITDKEGNVVHDSKQERIDEKISWGILIANLSHLDDTIKNIYLKSIKDPKNELIHLYEIRDYIAEKLGGSKKARKTLTISKKDWNLLGSLANNKPIREGRHRGTFADKLRKATTEELKSARGIAKKLIAEYLKFLQAKSES